MELRALAVAVALGAATTQSAAGTGGRFRPLFDGKTLKGWSAPDMGYWSVEDGAITARSSEARPCTANQFLVWQGGEPSDFELKLEFRIQGPPEANSGIQFRTRILPDGHAQGYQADIDRAGQYLGALYDEHTSRGMLASRGQRIVISEDGARSAETIGDAADLFKRIDLAAWNEYRIQARGRKLSLFINGKRTAEVVDRQAGEFDAAGKLALQLHSGPPTTVQFRNIRLRRL
ncbi:MAG: 3-keto-disaccharide hydrolase [Actinomycetota bacterium]